MIQSLIERGRNRITQVQVGITIARAKERFLTMNVPVYGTVNRLPAAYADGERQAAVIYRTIAEAHAEKVAEYVTLQHGVDSAFTVILRKEFLGVTSKAWADLHIKHIHEVARERAQALAGEIL